MSVWTVIGDFLANLFGFDQAHPLLFTQFYFWAFFAFVFAGYSLIRRDKTLIRNSWLFAASLFFYYKTSGVYLALLLFVIVYNYFAALGMRRLRREGARRALLALSVGVDLLVERLPLRVREVVHLLTDIVILALNSYITYLAVLFMRSSKAKTMPILKISVNYLYFSLLLGFGLMTIYSLGHCWEDIRDLIRGGRKEVEE